MAILFIVIFSLFLLQPALAINTGLEATATTAGFETGAEAKDPAQIVASIVKIALGFLGILFIALIIVSGFQWMTAGGNSDAIAKARSRIINAIIGLVIVLSAYAITSFLILKLAFL